MTRRTSPAPGQLDLFAGQAPATPASPHKVAVNSGMRENAVTGRRHLAYQATCLTEGCKYHSGDFDRENPAAEAAMDHAWPGWRDLPPVPSMPHVESGRSKAEQRKLADWAARVNAVYPAGWLEAGGPIRTLRDSPVVGRHVPARTPFGGYDLAVIAEATAA